MSQIEDRKEHEFEKIEGRKKHDSELCLWYARKDSDEKEMVNIDDKGLWTVLFS